MAIILQKRTTDPALDVACTQATEADHGVLRIPTARFGTLEVEADLVIDLPDGLIGFEKCKRYIVVRHDENSAFRWFQSLEEPAVALPILEPRDFRPDYAPTISDADARFLELTDDMPALVFVIVTVPPHNPRGMTANLLGPIVINGVTRRGKQVIVQDQNYTTRHEIMDELLRTASAPPQPMEAVAAPPPSNKVRSVA